MAIIIFIILVVLFCISLTVQLLTRTKEPPKPKTKTETVINWVVDTENVNRFIKYYRDELEDNDEYHLSAKELKEEYDHEKVYKYEPLELPLKLNDKEVYSQIEDEWLKVGRLKKTADLNGDLKLYLYVNEYKYVIEDEVTKEKEDSYFGVETTRTINL